MNQESPNTGGQTPPASPTGAEGAQTVPLMPPQMPMPMPGYPMPGHPMAAGYPPGWAPPGFNPYMYPQQGMQAPPGWPPGYPYPPPQMHGYPPGYPGMPPGYPLPPVAPVASPAAPALVAVAVAVVPEEKPAPAAAEPPKAPQNDAAESAAAPSEAAPAPASASPTVTAVATEEPGMTPILRLNPTTASQTREPNKFVKLWRKMGAGSLMLSIIIHGALLAVAGLIALTVTLQDKQVDFLPGGGTQQGAQASAALSEQIQVKQRKNLNKVMPKSRLVSTSISSSITLPEAPPDMLDVPDVSAALGGGRLGSSGFGLGGAGGGFGNGMGMGGMSGVTFKPLMMFGIELKDTRKIAVVMDVSRSMTKYLPIVVKELDKVARGSTVVMYFGCGLANPPKRKSDVDDKVHKAEGDDFASFWQNWQGPTPVNLPMEDRKKLRYDPAKKMPLDDIYQMMSRRKNTHYIEFSGIGYAWTALMSNEVKEADAVYWFADFQDRVDEDQMDAVKKRFKARKQKLFIHASVRGRSFEQVRDNLVIPLDGEVIETELPKK
ncbi:MAG: hypothetical protein ACO1TE_17570 [Prosthecobacter sp.]